MVDFGDACEGADVLAVLLCDGPEFAHAGGEALDVAGEEFQVHCEGLVAFCEPFKAFVYGHGVQSFAGWHALHGVGLWEALFGWPPFLTSDNEYYVNYRAGKENWPGPR